MLPRGSWRRGAAALLGPALLLAPVGQAAAQEEVPLGGLGFLDDDYAHVAYHFSSFRQGTRRWGEGELWLSLGGPAPRVRLKGYAYSPRFGHGEITLVLDSGRGVMYALLQLGELREAQCMSFPFPRSEDDPERLRRLRWRLGQVAKHWQVETVEAPGPSAFRPASAEVLAVNWTKSYTLDLLMSNTPGRVRGIDLRHGSRIVKTVRIKDVMDDGGEDSHGQGGWNVHTDVFTKPYPNCTPVEDVSDPLLLVEIKPPHKKSSALGDLLLVLADRAAGGRWPRAFLALCAVVVPGDVAVMIEEPPPPDLSAIDGLSFDYTAKVYRLGGNVSFDDPAADLQEKGDDSHLSSGSLILDLTSRSLRLHGQEQATKVGQVVTDLLAHSLGQEPKVYANVWLPAQGEHRCSVYRFPPRLGLGADANSALDESSRRDLTFVGIDALGGEDCGIFVASLPRGRRVYIWVDMESDRPGEFLRAEVRKDGRRLRRVDVLRWRTEEDLKVQILPDQEWNCTGEDFGRHPFVHLGLRNVQTWSMELQDALRSLRELPRSFVVLEMLALTGDVCLMVKEPHPPELWRLPGLSFSYTLFLGSMPESPATDFWVGEGPYTMGSIAVDHMKSRFQITANALAETGTTGAVNISLVWADGHLAVRLRHNGEDQCLTLSPEHKQISFSPPPSGIFDGVELIGDDDCDRFTFPGVELHENATVRFWLSRENPDKQVDAEAGIPGPVGGRVCQLQVTPPIEHGGTALLYVSDWQESYQPSDDHVSDWACLPTTDVLDPWVELAADPMDVEERFSSPALWPAATALGRLAQAFTVLGVFPQKWIDDVMARLIIRLPPKIVTTTTPAPLHFLSPHLQTISFTFMSTYFESIAPLHHSPRMRNVGISHHGRGELRADLAGRHLYLRSVAENISRGIPQLESEVYWSAEAKRIYARTKLEAEGYEQCWSVSVESPQELMAGETRNPFLRFIQYGKGKEVRDSGHSNGLERYILYLDPFTIAELFTDASSALSAIHFKDLKDPEHASSVGIMISEWSTQPVARGPLEPGSGWSCLDVEQLEGGHDILAWDIIRLLFPSA